ncbi:MAG: TolC family protein [Ignavibacteriaceae bacterium]|nr:TolC family protein [Ignavibacteriaceae bacterium]
MKYLIFLFTVSSFILSAQNINDTLYFTLNDAIKKALELNWDVQISRKDIQKSEEQVSEAYSNVFPRIDFTGKYIRNIKLPVLFLPPIPGFPPTLEIGSKNSFDAALTLSQVIYNQKINTAIQIAGEYSSYSKEGNRAARNDIALNVKKAYYNILLAKKLVNVSREGYQVAKSNYDNVASLYKQGVSSEYDFLRAEVQVANSEPGVIQSENNLALALNYLKNLLALDISKPIDVIGEFQYQDISSDLIESKNTEAIAGNPLIKQLTIQESLLDKNVTIQRSDYYPSLSFFGQYDFQSQDNTLDIKNYNWAKSFLLGIQLNYTLFDGFSRGSRIEQAVIDKEKIMLTRRKVEESLKIQILQADLKIEEARKRIKAQEKNLEQAEKTIKIAQTRYKNGVGTQLELIDTQAALTFAQTNYATALYDFLTAKAEWENAVTLENF